MKKGIDYILQKFLSDISDGLFDLLSHQDQELALSKITFFSITIATQSSSILSSSMRMCSCSTLY